MLTPPDWYTGASVLKADGSKTTLKDQLLAELRNKISPDTQNQVFQQVFLDGTTN